MKLSAFDLETSGTLPEYALQPWRMRRGESWITSFVGARRGDDGKPDTYGGVIDRTGTLTQPALRARAAAFIEGAIARGERIVGWNLTFDIAWLLAWGLDDLVFKAKWLDGMLIWKHVTIEPEYDTDRHRRKPYGLKNAVAEQWPEHAGYEDDIDYHDDDPEVRARLYIYNVRDTIFSLRLTKMWWDRLGETQRAAALIEADTLPLIAQANLEGMCVDVLAVKELEAHLTNVATQNLKVLTPHGVTEKVVRSPTQLGRLMFDVWKLPVLKENTGKKTGKVSRATDKEVLHELSFIDPRAKDLRAYREALNNRTKFATGILASVDYNQDGRTHPLAHVFGTYTSRLTYSSKQGRNKDERPIGFPLHQEKRDGMYRAAIAPPPGYTLMEFDASGQEYRWMAIASEDDAMLGLCMPGEDPHSYMGAEIAGVDYRWLQKQAKLEDAAGAMRQLGKVGNLSCCVGSTLVLTQRGLTRIDEVRAADLVWDGVEFVRHGGVICNGVRPVISYAGLIATSDHLVLVGGEWVAFGDAAANGWSIDVDPRFDWADIRGVDCYSAYADTQAQHAVRAGAVSLRRDEGGQPARLTRRAFPPVSRVFVENPACAAGAHGHRERSGPEATEACERHAAAMHQPERSVLAQLRRTWDRVSLWFGARLRGVDHRAPAARDVSWGGYRPDRQQWALRARKSATRDAQREFAQHARQYNGVLARRDDPASGLDAEPIQHHSCWEVCKRRPNRGADHRTRMAGSARETQGMARHGEQAVVYDILNCGPRNRFVANGLIVHNCQYRVSARKLLTVARVQYDMDINIGQAQHIHATYPRAYPGVKRYWGTQVAQARRDGYVETFAGRRVQLTGSWTRETEWQLGSTAINYRIQGTGGDQKYLALAVLRPYLRQHGVRFAWDLHDGLYFYVPNDKVVQVATEVKMILDNLPYKKAWGFTPPIPLPWDCKFGSSWGNMKEFKG